MSRSPEKTHLSQVPQEARRILNQAAKLEVELSLLAALFDKDETASAVSRLPQICESAREHRQAAELFLYGLAWDRVAASGLASRPVLVVDDAEDTRELAALALTAAGVQTITAANGLDALIAAHIARPRVILMDVNMPVLDGIEATRLLKAASATRDIHVIAHTGKTGFVEEPAASLFSHVLFKPAPPNQVVDSVRTFLFDSQAADPEFAQ